MILFASEYHAARGPYTHLPCGWLCPGILWYSSCANMLWSRRQCSRISRHWVPEDRLCPLVKLFRWGRGGCTTGSSMSTVGAISEILAPCSGTRHSHAFFLLICKSVLEWLACWVGVGLSMWYFADRCNFILCLSWPGIRQLLARSKLLGWVAHQANHSCRAHSSLLTRIHPDSETEQVLNYWQHTMQTNPDVHGI